MPSFQVEAHVATLLLISSFTNSLSEGEEELRRFNEIHTKLQATLDSLCYEADEGYGMSLAHHQEMISKVKKMLQETNEITLEHENFKLRIYSEMNKLEQDEKELQLREAEHENIRKKLRHQKKMNEIERKVLELAEDQKRGNEAIEHHILELGKHVDQRHQLELQADELGNCVKQVELPRADAKTRVTMDAIKQKLEETKQKLEEMVTLTAPLIAKERKSNDELQEARQEFILGLENNKKKYDGSIGVKTMGEFYESVFQAAATELYPRKDSAAKANYLISKWQNYIADSKCHPFQIMKEKDGFKEVIDIEDERLQSLREELGEEACWSVITTLNELNEYNPSGRYPVPELWNFSAHRKASLKEAAEFLIEQLWSIKDKKS